MSSSPTYLDPIIIPLIMGKTVLDVACGYGRWCHLIQSNFWEAGLKEIPIIDGLDAFESNVEYCKQKNCYRQIWQQKLPSPISGRWDTVLACEIIEHIEQERVEEVINLLEDVATKRIIFSTPNWPAFRPGGDTIIGYNDYEAHLSYVSRDFFRKKGYKVIGGGFGNPDNLLTRGVKKLFPEWSKSLDSIARILPILGNSTVAYKDFDQFR
jgi:SAM-dependent methyltransferase